MILEPVPKGK